MQFIFVTILFILSSVNPSHAQDTLISNCNNYLINGNYLKAQECYNDIRSYMENKYGIKSPVYAKYLNYLGICQKQVGDLASAEESFINSEKIFKANKGINRDDYIEVKYNLAKLWGIMGKFEDSYKSLLEIKKANLHNIDLTNKINNSLIFICRENGKHRKADSLKQIYNKETNKSNSEERIQNLTSFSAKLFNEGNIVQAKICLEEALTIVEQNSIYTRKYYNIIINNLATLYYQNNELDKANNLYALALENSKLYGETHPQFTNTLENYIKYCTLIGNWEKAESLYKKLNHLIIKQVEQIFPSLSSREQELFWHKANRYFDDYYSFIFKRMKFNSHILNDALNFRIKTKGILLNNSKQVANNSFKGNKEAEVLFNTWKQKKKKLAEIFYSSELGDLNESIIIDTLIASINGIEKELNKFLKTNDKKNKKQLKSWNEVKEKLSKNEAIIEVLRFIDHSIDDQIKVNYAFFIIKKNIDLPIVKIIENAEELESKYLKIYNRCIKNKIVDAYSFDRYFKVLEPELANTKTIYISCDGVYNQINIETIQDYNKQYLVNKYNFVRLTNLTDFGAKNKRDLLLSTTLANNATLFGNPRFPELDDDIIIPKTDKVNIYLNLLREINNLPGTEKEIRNIERILEDNNYKSVVFSEEDASKSNLLHLKSPNILHIATHGFFLSRSSNKKLENPYFRSGLIFAEGSSLQESIVTAYDILDLELSGTQLVILSACETGLGEIMIGEGVYGLQRAFQIAGVKSIIMSLWKIDDATTQLFMSYFYQELIRVEDIHLALYKTKIKIKQQYSDPYFWGSFILVENSNV